MDIKTVKFGYNPNPTFFDKIMVKIHHIPYRLRNIKRKWRLMKCVKDDKDWDYYFVYKLLLVKLENIQDYYIYDREGVHWNGNEYKIQYAINILKHLIDETLDTYPEHINTNNIKNYVPENMIQYYNFHNEDKPFKDWTLDCMRNIEGKELDRINRQEFYDIKARAILFKLLNNYLPYWWD